MIRYNTKRFWGYSADTKPAYAQIGDRFLELDTKSEYFLSTFNKWELIGNSGGTSTGVSGDYLPLSGGTVTGNTIFQSGLTANTISATTYLGLPTDVFTSGVTYSSNTFTFTNTTGGTYSVLFNTLTGLTINGNLGVTGSTSATTFYGDGSNLTGISRGGGSGGQIFYFNISVTQTPYYEFATTATSAAEQSITVSTGTTETAYIGGFLTPSNSPNITNLPAGIFSFYIHAYTSDINATFDLYCELYKRTVGSVETLLLTTDPTTVAGTSTIMYITDGFFSGATLTSTDRLLVKVYATNTDTQTRSITMLSEGSQHYSFAISTIPIGVIGSGTTNYHAKWTSNSTIGDSLIYDNGSIVVVSGTTATVAGSKFSVTGPIAAQGVQLSSKNGSIALATSNYASWTTGANQIAIGDGNTLGASTGTDNIAMGTASLKNAVTSIGNIGIGTETLNVIDSGDYNVAIGYETLSSVIFSGNNNIAFGYWAGKFSEGNSNLFAGKGAGYLLSGTGHVFIGEFAGRNTTTGDTYGGNVGIGYGALSGDNSSGNVAVGYQSLAGAPATRNVSIGTYSMTRAYISEKNVVLGYEAGRFLDQTDDAVYIGYRSGISGGTATNNVVVGSEAGLIYSGVNSVVIGKNALRDSTFGNGNVAIGVSAGRENYGGGNVFIGFGAGYYNNGNNRLYIHSGINHPPLIYGEFDNLRLGIATTAVTNTLHVSATTHPLRLEGLASSANTRYLVANSDGVVTYTTSAPGGSSGFTTISITGTPQFDSSASQVLNFSGINMTITSAATNTLVFSAGTGGGGGGVTSVTAGSGLSADSTTGAITIVATATTSFGVAVDGSGGVITTGQKGYVRIPYNFTITSWTLIGSPSGSITFDIWKRAGAIPTVANTIITGGTKPGFTTNTFATTSTLTGWNITGATGDVIGWNVDGCTATTVATLQLFVTRTS